MSSRMLLVAMLLGLALVSDGIAQDQRPPNIILIVADDMGYGDIGIHGSPHIPTPNIDALARAGIRFTDAYVSGPYCSPTRAGLLTGIYPQRFGHEFNLGPLHTAVGLPLEQVTLADRLRNAGYRTALFGKWHLGVGARYHPMSRGFDEFFGFLGGGHVYIDETPASPDRLLEGREPVAERNYLTDALTDRAVTFIERHKSRPFFLYLSYNAVHAPLQATEKYLNRFSHVADERRRTYAAMLSAMDDGIGRTLAALRAADLEDNTLIFFFSDNGGPTSPNIATGASNAPLRGSKRQTFEGGIRVPFVIRWKGHLPEGVVDNRPIIQLDVMPTALAAAGIPVSGPTQFDGVNLLPHLTGKLTDPPHEMLYWRLGESMAIRKGDWKLVKDVETAIRDMDVRAGPDLTGAQLFDLSADISERNDLAAARPEKVKELADAWLMWNRRLATPLWQPGREGER